MKRKYKILVILPFLLSISSSYASNMATVRQEGLDFGSIYKNKANSVITDQNKSSIPGYQTDNPEQTKYYYGADTSGDATSAVNNTEQGKLFKEGLPGRPKVEVSLADPFLKPARNIETSEEEVIRMFTGTYEQCYPVASTKSEDIETRTCDFYEERDGGSCLVDQVVEVEPYHNYQCNKTRNVSDKTCNKTLNLTCAEYYYAFPSTTHNTLPGFSYNNFNIRYTTPSRMGQNCGGYNYYLRFNLHSVDQVEEFRFLWGQADDRTLIYVNGNSVHNYPGSGCELSRTYYSAPNIDLKPYLREGNNELNVRIIVGGLGEGTGEFRLKYKECSKVVESWQEVCP